MMPPVEPEFRAALVNLRRVKALKPAEGIRNIAYAEWREQIADALFQLAYVMPKEAEKKLVCAEAEAALVEAAKIWREIKDGHET